MSKTLPFLSLQPQLKEVKKDADAAIQAVLSSGNFILGKSLAKFENEFAKYSGVKFCAGTANGHDAIYLSLRALDVGAGDEVIVPSNTCAPTWLAVALTGAKIIPVEPNIRTYNIDPGLIGSAITSKTKAIVPVHLYGQACDMTSIMKNKIPVIEDNAQGHGATHGRKRTGSFGAINATSFYPTKNLGAFGDGGAITTADGSLYKKILALRNYGSAEKNVVNVKGINSRLDELQAAILSVRLKKLDAWNRQRISIANIYNEQLGGVGDLVLPLTVKGSSHVYHLFVVRTPRRDKLRSYLASRGIETMTHYPVPPHLQKAFKDHGFKKGQFPVAEEIARTCLSLPLWPGMGKKSIERVITTVRSFYK